MAAEMQSTVPMDVLVAVIAIVQFLVHALVQLATGFMGKGKDMAKDSSLDEIKEMLEEAHSTTLSTGHMLRDLYDMHKITDPKDGRPMWFFPPVFGDMQREQTTILRQLSDGQRDLLKILERLERRSDRRYERELREDKG